MHSSLALSFTSFAILLAGPVIRRTRAHVGQCVASTQVTHPVFCAVASHPVHSSASSPTYNRNTVDTMRPFPMPPSSPTPHSTQDQEGAPPLVGDMNSNSRRALTRAASSDVESGRHASYTNSTGYVTATGLINWRRKKRRSTAARSTAGSDNGKLGPGMGMQGTPARRKKRRTGTGKVSSEWTNIPFCPVRTLIVTSRVPRDAVAA